MNNEPLIQCEKCKIFVSPTGAHLDPQPEEFMRVVVPGMCEFCVILKSIRPGKPERGGGAASASAPPARKVWKELSVFLKG